MENHHSLQRWLRGSDKGSLETRDMGLERVRNVCNRHVKKQLGTADNRNTENALAIKIFFTPLDHIKNNKLRYIFACMPYGSLHVT